MLGSGSSPVDAAEYWVNYENTAVSGTMDSVGLLFRYNVKKMSIFYLRR